MLMNKTQSYSVTFFLLSVIFSFTIASSITSKEVRRPLITKYETDIQHIEKSEEKFMSNTKSNEYKSLLPRKIFIEIGSQPPNCEGGCDNCTPCNPTLVAVPPQQIPESKPEIWKCQCGETIYDPPKK
ncbi:EPIDERMAL PATTERNING FACTOR-like protein 6 [Vicia villosa]|uniref:EPIDERMAL PATTERNING FACTOR-like protein 6 n=1 Tax=Vicia villosa TaxID=3911 RepID=UPI00273CC80A|nr:EPIDERMAL PATTERNING FACTOR-like protein 6 [Vicia villosa]